VPTCNVAMNISSNLQVDSVKSIRYSTDIEKDVNFNDNQLNIIEVNNNES